MFNTKQKYIYVAIIVFVFVCLSLFPKNFIEKISSKVVMFADVLSSVLISETNNFRLSNNEGNLIENDLLMSAAQMKANDMASRGYFSHVSPSGEKPWVWFDKVGYKYDYAGENLAVDYTESSDITQAWVDSTKHKANLLNKTFTEIGVGISKGIFEGHETIFVVQFFGTPSKDNEIEYKLNNYTSKSDERDIASISPTVAVMTWSDSIDGEVLGMEVKGMTFSINYSIVKISFISLGILIFVVILIKIVLSRQDQN